MASSIHSPTNNLPTGRFIGPIATILLNFFPEKVLNVEDIIFVPDRKSNLSLESNGDITYSRGGWCSGQGYMRLNIFYGDIKNATS